MQNKLITAFFIVFAGVSIWQGWFALGVLSLWLSTFAYEGVLFE